MALLGLDSFAHVFEELKGKRVGFTQTPGNAGDALIQSGTFQLMRHFGIKWKRVSFFKPDLSGLDILCHSCGGTMGEIWGLQHARQALSARAAEASIPVLLFPQSFPAPSSESFYKVFVREKRSLLMYPGSILAPDFGLAYETDRKYPPPGNKRGIFLRTDIESFVAISAINQGDPCQLCKDHIQYLYLASQYEEIISDRLHFVVAALILGRKAAILPNSYHKNRAMWETWLKDLGCEWLDSIEETI